MFSSGDANVEWMEDDASVIPVLSATREADGSVKEQPESTKSAIAFDFALNWWNVGVLPAVALNTSFALVIRYCLYLSTLVICC